MTHFALWSSLSAPLIISAWIPGLSAEEIHYLTNKDIIAIDQDPLALQATLVSQDGTWDVLTKNLANGDRLLTLVNRGNFTASHNVSFERIGMPTTSAVMVKDLWTGSTTSASQQVIASNVPSHGTAIFRLSGFGGAQAVIPTGMVFNTYSLNVLSISRNFIEWTNSTGATGQVWQTRSDSTLRSLSNPSSCVTDLGYGKVGMETCSGTQTQKWDYRITGNVQSQSSKLCLTEAGGGAVTTSKCLIEVNSQVFALPSGVEIIQRS